MDWHRVFQYWSEYLLDYTIALGVVLLFFILSRIFSRYIIRVILHCTAKTKTYFYTKVVQSFQGPLTLLIVALGFYLAALHITPVQYEQLLGNLYRSLVIIALAGGFYNLTDTSSQLLVQLGEKYQFDKVILSLVSKTLRVLIVIIAVTMIAQPWGFEIGGLLTGLGIGGLAVALAAQDALANIVGGIVIIVEKPFTIGDWIHTPDVEGTVEDITFRSTKIRTFAHAQVTVPNSSLAKQPITNWSRMGRRRITFKLGVTYTTPRHKLQRCVERIRAMLTSHPDIHPQTIFANFEGFNESSLDILIYCFSKTTVWGEWLKVREDVNFRIMAILEEEGVEIAFPSRSIYLETPFPCPGHKQGGQN